ncbi:UNVERIFIED_CONTAM: hypothetical protein Slati_2466900 [Sesamum latifolium]|uniref:Reverse transcriptase domain-containing protein n=1 Tax=Sesamum latifolium TaxID=2727402 RepID=A0AAW2WDM0_9LAMI
MSPYLFVLVMEVLTLLLRQIIDQDGGFSYHWKCGAMQLCQLGFADDLLLFSKADTSSVHIFKRALAAFADLSGLRANLHKSHLILSRSIASRFSRKLMAVLEVGMEFVSFTGRVQLIKSILSDLQGSTDVGYAKVSWQQLTAPPFGWIVFSIIGFGISLFGRSVIGLDHGGGGNWFACGIGFDRLFVIRLGNVLPSLYGMTRSPYSSVPLGTTAHVYT